MKNWERHCDSQIYRKDFICRRPQTFTTLFRPIKWFICNCNTDPSSIFKTSSTLCQKIRLPIDFKTEIEYLKSIWKCILNYCLTQLDTFDEFISEIPASWDAPSSNETPPTPQTIPEETNETTIPNTEAVLHSAVSNDDEMDMNTASIKRPIHENSSEEEPTSPFPSKRTAPGSPTSRQNGTVVPKGTGRGNLSKISTCCPNAQKLGRVGGGVEWGWGGGGVSGR